MSTRAHSLRKKLRLALIAAACGVAPLATPHAQGRTTQDASASLAQNTSASTAQVAQALARVRSPSANEETFAEAFAVGVALVREGRFAEAAEVFGALADRRPRDRETLYWAALATFNAGHAADAEPLARRATDAALADARDAWGDGARQLKSRAADALTLLAVVLAVRGDDAGALKSVEQAVALAPENFDAQLALGRARFGAGDDAGAVATFRAAVALNPRDARARFFLATALERAGDADGALAAYRELAVAQPRASEGHLGLGVLLLKRGGREAEEGIRELQRALEIDPNIYEARVALGRALVARGRAAEAVEHLRRAAELAPANPEPHYQLSLAYRRLGRGQEAAAESAIVKRIHESRRATGASQNAAPPED